MLFKAVPALVYDSGDATRPPSPDIVMVHRMGPFFVVSSIQARGDAMDPDMMIGWLGDAGIRNRAAGQYRREGTVGLYMPGYRGYGLSNPAPFYVQPSGMLRSTGVEGAMLMKSSQTMAV